MRRIVVVLAEHQTDTRHVVVAMRQRKGRTRTFVVRQEDESVSLVADRTLRLALTHKVSRNWKGYWQRAINGEG